MKICSTCSTKTVRGAVFAQQEYFRPYYPREPREFRPKDRGLVSLQIMNLRRDALVFYFAARGVDRLDEPIVDRAEAYSKLENSGVVRTDAEGTATLVLRCPVVYRVEGGKIFPRHLHYVYWDGNGWEKRLYTHRIDCPITKTAVQRYPEIPRIDARYDSATPGLPQAIHIPANQQRLRLPKTEHAGEVPLIVYCSDPECPAAEELIDRLAARGFVNTFWYRGGIRDFFSRALDEKKK